MKPVRYKARDGMSIPAYLVVPKGIPAKNLPTVMLIHGGPWARVMWGYNGEAQYLANRGYAVFVPNFRGSTGDGKKFLNSGNKQWGIGAMQHDITDGVKYLTKQKVADPKKVAIYGGSYGGYATLAGLAFTPDLYAAGICYVRPSNIITLLNSIPPYCAPMKKLFDVAPTAFRPTPKVVSALVRLVPLAQKPDCDEAALEKIVREAFSARRKTLRNALPLEPGDYAALGIDPGLRPENLSPADFRRIARRISACVR